MPVVPVSPQVLHAAVDYLECHVSGVMHQQIGEEVLLMNEALAEAIECGRVVVRQVSQNGESSVAARNRLIAALKVVKELLA